MTRSARVQRRKQLSAAARAIAGVISNSRRRLLAAAALRRYGRHHGPRPVQRRGLANLWRQNPSRIPRLEIDFRGPRRRQPQRYPRHSRQRRSDQGLSGSDTSIPRRRGHRPARLELPTIAGKQQSLWSSPVLRRRDAHEPSVHGQGLQANTPRPAAGGSLSLTTASLPPRRRRRAAFPATRPSRARDFVFNRYAP